MCIKQKLTQFKHVIGEVLLSINDLIPPKLFRPKPFFFLFQPNTFSCQNFGASLVMDHLNKLIKSDCTQCRSCIKAPNTNTLFAHFNTDLFIDAQSWPKCIYRGITITRNNHMLIYRLLIRMHLRSLCQSNCFPVMQQTGVYWEWFKICSTAQKCLF